MLEACVFATVLCGFFDIIFKKNLVMKIISMDIISTEVIAGNKDNVAYGDPVPQAVILTAKRLSFWVLLGDGDLIWWIN